MMNINFAGEMAELTQGIEYIQKVLPFSVDEKGVRVIVEKGNELLVSYDGICGRISYVTKASFFRMLSLFIQNIKKEKNFEIREKIRLEACDVSLDMSRNGVMRVESIKNYMAYMASMGLNGLTLYMEDVFEVKERPYFGYMRGRYSYDELKELDDYGYALGIEVYPTIEVLGHMEQYLKYWEATSIRDTPTVLLAESEETYEFLELLIQTVTKPFRSKRIALSMDETHDLGLGNYLKKFGYKERIQIFLAHLNRVAQIAEKYELTAKVCADMFFRLASKTGDYYDKGIVFTQDILEKVPPNVILSLWYYRGENPDGLVESLFANQKVLSENMAYEGAVWSFRGFLCDHRFGLENAKICLPMCKKYNVSWVNCNIFGDNGCECDYFYTLLTVQAYGEHMYNEVVTDEQIKERFEFVTGADYEAFLRMSDYNADFSRIADLSSLYDRYVGKTLFWQDIMMGLLDDYLSKIPMADYYKKLAEDLRGYDKKKDKWCDYYVFAQSVCDMLALKCEIAENIRNAYLNNDRKYLVRLTEELLPLLQQKVKSLKAVQKKMWHVTYKPFGFECLDVRYGGLDARIETAIQRISDYLNGTLDRLEELEEVRLPYHVNDAILYERIYTASSIR